MHHLLALMFAAITVSAMAAASGAVPTVVAIASAATPARAPSAPEQAASSVAFKGIELLFEYTKFHIGVYLTLASAFATIASIQIKDKLTLPVRKPFVWVAVAFLMVAGFAGGVVASTLTECFDAYPERSCPNTMAFLELETGPYGWPLWTGRIWTRIEHTGFWIGVFCAALAFTEPGFLKRLVSSLSKAASRGKADAA